MVKFSFIPYCITAGLPFSSDQEKGIKERTRLFALYIKKKQK